MRSPRNSGTIGLVQHAGYDAMNADQDRTIARGTGTIRATPAINLPNKLTLSRIMMVPVFVAVLSFHYMAAYILAFLIFTVATITDYYDGKIARERNLITNFGKLFDPVADKVLVAAAFVMLMKLPELHVPGWTIVAILAREFMVTGARTIAASDGSVIAASRVGKIKTILQMAFIFMFLFFATLAFPIQSMGSESLSASYLWYLALASYVGSVFIAAFTVYSGIHFVRENWKSLKLDQLS